MTKLTSLALIAAITLAGITDEAIAANKGDRGTNLQPVRPFFIYGHNPNTLDEMRQILATGANALEPDLYRFAIDTIDPFSGRPINERAGPSGLFVAHDASALATRFILTLEDYLKAVRLELLAPGTNAKRLAAIAFDIKTPAAEYLRQHPLRMKLVQQAVNDNLNKDGVRVNIVYNVGSFDDAGPGDPSGLYATLCLAPHEGIMIDGEYDPEKVYKTLWGQINAARRVCPGGVVPMNIGFGAGSIGESGGFIVGAVPEVRTAVQQASWLRTALPIDLAVIYAYPIASARFGRYFAAGVDGLIPDLDLPQLSITWSQTLEETRKLVAAVTHSADHYLASADDNPFAPRKHGYGIRVLTRTNSFATDDYGTNSDVQFTLEGSCGSASITVAGNDALQFKSGNLNYVTIPSRNLGRLSALVVWNQGTDQWYPLSFTISSDRWGIPEALGAGFVNDRGYLADDVAPRYRFTGANAPGKDYACNTDTQPMTAAPSQTPAATLSGFTTSNSVLVKWNWQDPSGSGLDMRYCTTQGLHTLADGRHTLSARCESVAGNQGEATRVVTVDTTAPTVGISSPSAGAIFRVGQTLKFGFSASDATSGVASLRPLLNGSSRVAGLPIADGLIVPVSALPLGTNTFELTATDRAGHVRRELRTFTVLAN